MKRCPQCLFLYPDSDENCDFDKTPLEVVDDSALDAATRPPVKRRSLPIAVAIGLILAVLGFAIYFAVNYQIRRAVIEAEKQNMVEDPPSPAVTPSPSPVSS